MIADTPASLLTWLLESPEPWTRYRTLVDLLDRTEADPEVQAARAAMLAHPQVQALIAKAASWPGEALKRHNDASHPIYALSTLADFGLRADDPGLEAVVATLLAHQSPEGAFQNLLNISPAFGGSGQDQWTWVACDAPTLLYTLLAMGVVDDPRVQRAATHLAGLAADNGWRCVCAPELGKFRGPGKKADACPIANVYALKALALIPEQRDSPAARSGMTMLLDHWSNPAHPKPYLFGVGSDYRKLKYPFIWYDILHVADVLSRFPAARADPRLPEMLTVLRAQSNAQGGAIAASMYQAWKGWSFANKKDPSPWLTFLILCIQKRLGAVLPQV